MIQNHQRRVRIHLPPLEEYFAQLRKILRLHGEVASIWFVDDAQMAQWNRDYRGKRGSTDVLSFPASANGDQRDFRAGSQRREDRGYLGDIAISAVVAKRNARRFHRTLPQELRILILHGVLHLLGYDHERDNGEMERVEAGLRARLGLN